MDVINQNLTDDAKAILLLCGRFGKNEVSGAAQPLSLLEYNRLAELMMNWNIRPADLLSEAPVNMATDTWAGIDTTRIRKLLSRGAAMAFAVERWTHNGIWIVCRSDDDYPERLKSHLKRTQAPPILFGVGDKGLLSKGGLAVVGSRKVNGSGEAFTRKVGEKCARDGMLVVSGGARGVDQVAMLSALNAGGSVIGVMADGLFKAAISGKYREGIRERRLVLVSPFHPEARFMIGNAMGRNKLVYALADFALVVSAEKGKGGTWTGAKEELNRVKPKPVFVRLEEDSPEGNRALIDIGAMPFPDPPWKDNLRKLLKEAPSARVKSLPSQVPLFAEPEPEPVRTILVKEERGVYEDQTGAGAATPTEKTAVKANFPRTAYEAVLPVLLNALQDWKTPKDLAMELEIHKVQLDDWIRRAVKEDIIEKKSRPVRYRRK